MAHELSIGALHPLQKADDAIQDVMEHHSVNEEDDDIDDMEHHSVNEDDDDIESGSTSSLNSDTDSNDFLVPKYENPGPDPDDLGAPSQSTFTRTFIRQVVKKMEPLIRQILTGRHTSQFANNTSSIKAFRKENPYWPLEKCSDMVHEIELYLVGVQDDVGKRASMTLSQLSKFIVWPEIITAVCNNLG
ncbi:hypothetical protein EMCRGX_G012221 [Ephydatia muelleri]